MFIVLGLVAAAAGGAWIGATMIESPADAAARTAAPPPSPILVPVESRVLSSDVVTRGTARFGLPQPLAVVPSALKAGPGLIATLPARSTPIEEGQVLLVASGRPVLVLAGRVPTYRDLSPGISGEDVRQLEAALARLGFDPGPVDGTYDAATADAVARWYRARGHAPFGATRDQQAAIRTMERELADAMRSRIAATIARASAAEAVAAARALADHAARTAALESATRAADRRAAQDARGGGPASRVENERARAEAADAAAAAELATRMADRALIVLDPRQPEMARINADAQLEVARANQRRARMEGEMAVQAAQAEAGLAEERVRVADTAVRAARLEGARNVRAAQDAQKVADYDAQLAIERADQLAAELDAARARLGVQVPADELIFIATLPVRVEEVTATIGAPAAGNVMTVTDNQLAVDSALPIETAPLVRPGMAVQIDERALGLKATGTVRQVASTPGTRGVDGYHFWFEVKVDETPLRLEGFSVRLTIPIETTRGAVMAVPVTALSLGPDGGSRVQVERDGALEFVVVTPGLSAGGFVEVTPLAAGLKPGDQVVVGYRSREGPPQ
jgi:peptidoglycan hydrolase-like protein with peptidoglycan-binding domain